MAKSLRSLVSFLLMIVATLICLGNDKCTKVEPASYCKKYKSVEAQAECTTFCKTHPDLAKNAEAVRACQFGQAGFIYNRDNATATELVLQCDRYYNDSEQARGCRLGVTGEELRASKNSLGTANDRETGN